MILWMRDMNKSGKARLEFTGFDMQTPDVAMRIVAEFVEKHDPQVSPAVGRASELARGAGRAARGPDFGLAVGTFPVSVAAGKRVRFSGYIKTEGVTQGFAGLWWRVDGKSGVLAFDNMQDRGATATTDWKRYELELPVAAEATNINFGVLHPGNGTAWFDALAVELDGKPYLDPDLFDFDFESSTPRGFQPRGPGYDVRLDAKVFHRGTQSLRMEFKESLLLPSAPATDPKIAAANWKDVIARLEAGRASYRGTKVPEREIEWVIQNARVVLQCMQMRSDEISRDRSMAENVRWILDRLPDAKIVLWAHNGHVSTVRRSGYEPMGAALRRMFGDQMVVFGFAFNRGSFQAIEQSRGLRDFTVAPAPPGSLDATLAASGLPVLALDLRRIPVTGPVARWWNEPHRTRSIGAVYCEAAAETYLQAIKAPECFDAILFVERTTAALKNPGR
jgi:hypothetical protein